ncbi:MAG: hypothetical protein ACJATA_001110 [Sphingobacteriales bacterium]|jgi:hypothetical protein
MKKIVFIVLVAFTASVALTSCQKKVACPAYGSSYSKAKTDSKSVEKRRDSRGGNKLY